MYRLNEMIGKAVMSTANGQKLGTVSDALLEPDGTSMLGLVVGSGMLGKDRVLPLSDIQTVGADAILVRTDQHMLSAREWRQSEVDATRSSSVRGRRVVTDAGQQIGRVSDLLIDEHTGALAGLEVEESSLGGLRHRRSVVNAPPMPRIGPDAVVVSMPATETSTER